MKYFVVDVETTGALKFVDKILEVGFIFEDPRLQLPLNEIPKFHCLIKHDEIVFSNDKAREMNLHLVEMINNPVPDGPPVYSEKEFIENLRLWLMSLGFLPDSSGQIIINISGKNAGGFDAILFERIPNWDNYFRLRTRVFDPTVFFVDILNDDAFPNQECCLERAGVEMTVKHRAIDDSWQLLQLNRMAYPLLTGRLLSNMASE